MYGNSFMNLIGRKLSHMNKSSIILKDKNKIHPCKGWTTILIYLSGLRRKKHVRVFHHFFETQCPSQKRGKIDFGN